MLNKKNQLKILRTIGEMEYVLYKSTSEECKNISLGKISTSEEIVAHGESKTMDERTANAILPEPATIDNLLSKVTETAYKCWCCESLDIQSFVGHRTSLRSWDCLMNAVGNPAYVIITQRKIKDVAV